MTDDVQLRLDAALLALQWLQTLPTKATLQDVQDHAAYWIALIESASTPTLLNRLDTSSTLISLVERERKSPPPLPSIGGYCS